MLWSECVLQKFICWKPNLQYDGVRRCILWGWLSYEDGVLVSEISVLRIRNTGKLASTIFSNPWRHRKKVAICKPGREFPAKANHASTLISDFQPPDLWQIYTCFLSHLVQVFELQQPDQNKILVIRCYSYSFMGKFYFLWSLWIDVNEGWSCSFLL